MRKFSVLSILCVAFFGLAFIPAAEKPRRTTVDCGCVCPVCRGNQANCNCDRLPVKGK